MIIGSGFLASLSPRDLPVLSLCCHYDTVSEKNILHFLLVPGTALYILGFDFVHPLVLWANCQCLLGMKNLALDLSNGSDKDFVVQSGWEKQMACLVRMEEGHGG